MKKLRELYDFIGEEPETWDTLNTKYPYTDFYVTQVQDDFFTVGTAHTICVSEIVKGETTKFGGQVYKSFKKFVAIANTKDGYIYNEVALK